VENRPRPRFPGSVAITRTSPQPVCITQRHDAGMARTLARGPHLILSSPANRPFGQQPSNPRAEVRLLPGPSWLFMPDPAELRWSCALLRAPRRCPFVRSRPLKTARARRALAPTWRTSAALQPGSLLPRLGQSLQCGSRRERARGAAVCATAPPRLSCSTQRRSLRKSSTSGCQSGSKSKAGLGVRLA
jgi:hypothetical protein